ncbi:MAG TPA: hypothetical protein VL961_02140 [Acidimicrobiales bacterium]|nr:hypothetical protein [Acidimicrobiales bacterium]
MSSVSVLDPASLEPGAGGGPAGAARTFGRFGSWIPSWTMITAKNMELRRRRGLMVAVAILTIALPVLVLGIRMIFHAVDPKAYGPAGSPGLFEDLCNPMAELGFIIAAALGTTAGSTDLSEGVFRHLVVTGRSRLALYLARIPAGLAILIPMLAIGFSIMCLVTNYEGSSQPTSVNAQGVSIPLHLSESQFRSWLHSHPNAANNLSPIVQIKNGSVVTGGSAQNVSTLYTEYIESETAQLNPSISEMVKIGSWLALDLGVGFVVGVGLGSLIGQRTVSTVLLIGLQIIVTPILASTVIPYFLDGQRVFVGIALDQLRPAGLVSGLGGGGGGGGPGHMIFGGRGALGIPPMPTWAMIAVIVGWIVGWSVIGAWRMMTRDA